MSKEEFLKAYNKNNNDTAINTLSYADYLELYIRFKLKVQAALDAGLDTTAEQKAELQSFRYQLAESFIREDASINLLVDEAIDRAKKDIHLSDIFIPADRNSSQEVLANAEKRINEVYKKLNSGQTVNKAAAGLQQLNLGYITSFVLPYNFESIAYNTPVGKYSVPFQSQTGYHILRNDGERKAIGKIRVAQILLAYSPFATDQEKKLIPLRADSIYKALQGGADFTEMAKQFSDDQITFYSGGELPAFGVGQYDTTFENAAFALAKDGDISKPFATSFGYHILKRLQRVPVPEEVTSEWKEVVRERVLQSDRMQVAHDKLLESIRKTVGNDAGTEDLASDSAVLDYYRAHLEKYNHEFAEQLQEFREGNLLFSIMQKNIWDAAAEDSAGLKKYFEQNRSKYYWENSADALIVTVLVEDSLSSIQDALRKNHKGWRDIVESHNGLVQVDSSRFDLAQIPVVDRTRFTNGLITAPVSNDADNSKTFAYIIKMYEGKSPKTFADARGSVINDYQAFLEERWITELKKKYPVKINQKVFDDIKTSTASH